VAEARNRQPNMSDTKDFDVIRVCRSDGADTGPGYWPATAPVAPLAKKPATDKAPRAKPQMTRLTEDDPRFIEWRVKLGILLKQELSPSPDEGNAWYVEFPRGYWLYEKSKHLWVSGYPIKGKLFKTPQEFALHLIWLLSSSKEYRDCCCVHCNIPSLPRQTLATEDALVITPSDSPAKADKPLPKVTPVPLPPMPGQSMATKVASPLQASPIPVPRTDSPRAAAVPASTATQTQTAVPIPKPIPATQAHNSPAQASQVQAPQPQTTPAQQQVQQQTSPTTLWTLKSPLLFRVGELVWYQNGNTWRLGAIAASNHTHGHELLPLGHTMVPQPNVLKTDHDMRPFYAFSVPGVTIPDLKDKTFDDIPWEAMLRGLTPNEASKRDLLLLDASKTAASRIDHAYSLWSPMHEDPSGKTIAYYGCFFGAERVEIGDCMRLRQVPMELNVSPDSVYLGLRTIFTSTDYPGAVFFRGHVYQLIKGAVNLPNALPDEALPVAIRDEAAWRRQVSNATPWRWMLVKENVVFQEQSLRGRFYPTHRLSPILNPGRFQDAVQNGQIDDQFAQLNNRMDGPGKYLGRKRNRLDALGPSVAHGSRLSFELHVKEDPDGGVAPP
jgi:hypothetical protein